MNIRALEYLVALADHRHFGKAAEACFVSQPALSVQIKKLEENLGVKLLERTNKSVLLTDIGTTIAERVRHILNQIDEVREITKLAKDPYSGELKIGIFPTLAPYLLPHIIPPLSAKFPKLMVYLVEEQTAFLVASLKQGKLDAAILALPVLETGLTAVPLFEEEFMLAISNSHSFAKRKMIKQSELENNNLLLLENGHCMREQALALCHKANALENKSFRATSLETLRHMVAAGVGITLMPKLACKTNDGIAYIPFDKLKPKRCLGMVWRTSSAKQLLLENMSNHIKKIMLKQKAIKVID